MLLQSWIVRALGILSLFLSHYKKRGYPSICKSSRLAPKAPKQAKNVYPSTLNCYVVTVGIKSPNLYQCLSIVSGQVSAHFQHCSSAFTCVRTILTNSFENFYQQISEPIPTLFNNNKKALVQVYLYQRFYNRPYRVQSIYENMNTTYTSTFKSADIRNTYSSVFESASIGFQWIK